MQEEEGREGLYIYHLIYHPKREAFLRLKEGTLNNHAGTKNISQNCPRQIYD